MSIDSGEISMMPSSVEVDYLSIKSFFIIFKIDNPPPVKAPFNSTINNNMIKNRKLVNSGSVVGWTDHGRIAVVKQSDGLEAAFWCYELKRSKKQKEIL
jgi:hypothetical protein